jgi:ribosomal protein S27AE
MGFKYPGHFAASAYSPKQVARMELRMRRPHDDQQDSIRTTDEACPVCRGTTTVSRIEPHVAHEGWEIHTYTCPKCGPSRTRVVRSTAAPPEAA